MNLSERERAIRLRLKNDFPHYAEKCLYIRTKEGSVEPLKLNKAQLYMHSKIEEQLAETGKVRAIILKGRQQGCSTYTEARYFWKVTHRKGAQAFVLTHLDEATRNIFGMAKRFYENCPEIMQPSLGASNAQELKFDKLDSGYKVGTAKSQGTGRSQTIQFFHGSEVAFWSNADTHAAGALQAVPDIQGTEVILESTANGVGNFFHSRVMESLKGNSDYRVIFIPWFWQDEYQKPIPNGFIPTAEETLLKAQYGLTDEQIAWRRDKIKELGRDSLFKQEYPCDIQEAFQFSGHESFIRKDHIIRARSQPQLEYIGPKIIGVDVASEEGHDSCAIAFRQGRQIHWVNEYPNHGPISIVSEIQRLIKEVKPHKVFVDKTGLGWGTVDRLHELGHRELVVGITTGGEANRNDRYSNKRMELWGEFDAWLQDAPNKIPDDDALMSEILAMGIEPSDSNGRLVPMKKEKVKKLFNVEQDRIDAVLMTFAEPVSDWSSDSFTPKLSII